jgi:excisionase family DNA binding protein
MPDIELEEVLTLAEAASFLRVEEDELLGQLENREIPGQHVGKEWRLSKKALLDWLRFGREYRKRPWFLDHPILEELLYMLEKRLLDRLAVEKRTPTPGSKQAVLRHAGVFKDEKDLPEILSEIESRRKAVGE